METVNPLLASALDFLKQGDVERAEKEFTEATVCSVRAFGEARSVPYDTQQSDGDPKNTVLILVHGVYTAVQQFVIRPCNNLSCFTAAPLYTLSPTQCRHYYVD